MSYNSSTTYKFSTELIEYLMLGQNSLPEATGMTNQVHKSLASFSTYLLAFNFLQVVDYFLFMSSGLKIEFNKYDD